MATSTPSTLLVQAPAEERQTTKEQASWAADFDLDIRTIVIAHPQVENVQLTPTCSCDYTCGTCASDCGTCITCGGGGYTGCTCIC